MPFNWQSKHEDENGGWAVWAAKICSYHQGWLGECVFAKTQLQMHLEDDSSIITSGAVICSGVAKYTFRGTCRDSEVIHLFTLRYKIQHSVLKDCLYCRLVLQDTMFQAVEYNECHAP